ncbi:MAG: ester cyclase [Chloroflexi bacterium]|nr:ester cyclase [Chloroflexota bacterium]
MSQTMNEFVNNLIAAWNSHDVAQTEKFYAEDYVGVDVAQAVPQQGRPGFRSFFAQYLNAVPDFQFIVDDVIADDNRVAVAWNACGTHLGALMNIPPTGKSIAIRGVSLFTIENERIKQAMYVWDLAGLLRDIGLLPEL